MKKVTVISLCMVLAGFQTIAQNSISGTITYDNSASTPMNNCTVYLCYGSDTVAQTISSSTGEYSFTNLGPGTYQVKVKTTKLYVGGSSADAIGVLRQFVGMPPILSGMCLKAADVNGDLKITPADALLIIKRFCNQIPGFYPPFVSGPGTKDWLFEETYPTLTTTSVIANIKAINAGDANGNYIPVL